MEIDCDSLSFHCLALRLTILPLRLLFFWGRSDAKELRFVANGELAACRVSEAQEVAVIVIKGAARHRAAGKAEPLVKIWFAQHENCPVFDTFLPQGISEQF